MSDNLPAVLLRPLQWGEAALAEGEFVLPTGTVTLLLADVEGSTRRWETDVDGTRAAIVALNELVDETIGRHDGVRPVEQGEGDSFVAAFARAGDAVLCALAIQRELPSSGIRLRIGIHTGEVQHRDEGNYVGPTINRTARLRNIAHGGQTVLSQTARDLVVDRLPDNTTLRDLGVHRLKDLARAEHVYQLCHPDLVNEFPALRSLDASSHNLPAQRTSFVGRHTEIAEVKTLLHETSLLTLVGAGGCGKTRLALQVAADLLDEMPDGVWFADLAAIADPSAVPAQVMAALSPSEGPSLAATDALCAYLEQRRTLLLLDNCEHVVDAAGELAEVLLSSCPNLTLLATSRQRLGVDGEVTLRVPSLSLPEDDGPRGINGLNTCTAVQLFTDRARRARPGFEVNDRNSAAVNDICRHLDGIPLAIELAAARCRVFTPAQIADGLVERFRLLTGGARTALPRQQTLEASVDWSHQLLTEPEGAVFRRLSVFASSFTFEAAEDVCVGEGVERHQVLDLLSLLVDKSLVTVDDSGERARYRMLETIRAYARAKLAESGDEVPAYMRHRDHYLAFVEEAEPHWEGPGQAEWLERGVEEYPNVRAALEWSRDRRDAEAVLRIAAANALLWEVRGPNLEGVEWLDFALSLDADVSPVLRARALFGRAFLGAVLYETDVIMATTEEGIPLAESASDQRLVARLKMARAIGCSYLGAETPLAEESVAISRTTGDEFALAECLCVVAMSLRQRDPDAALHLFQESVDIAASAGNIITAQMSTTMLGVTHNLSGDLPEAERLLRAALDLNDKYAMFVTFSLANLAQVLLFRGQPEQALEVADRLDTVGRELGYPTFSSFVPLIRGLVELDRANEQTARAHLVEACGCDSTLPHGGVLRCLAECDLAFDHLDEAQQHLDEAAAADTPLDMTTGNGAAEVTHARLARRRGDLKSSAEAALDGLARAQEHSAKCVIVDALEALAGVTCDLARNDEAARYLGAAQAIRDTTEYRRHAPERDPDVETLNDRMGTPAFDEAYAEGRALIIEEAVAYARRGRGERTRPSSGWDSLSPAELQVVELVKSGLTNAEIAERMFVSPRTTQAHLTHIYAKVGVTSRTELAVEATRRRS